MEPTELNLDAVDVRAAVRVYNKDIVDRLLASDALGAVLLAPRILSLEDDPIFPLLGLHAFRTNEPYGPNRARSVLTLVHPERNEVWATRAIRRNDEAPDAPGVPTEYEARSVGQFSLDLRERLPRLAWRPGRYLATVHILDQPTNRARFVVTLGPEYDRDPAVAEFLARRRTLPLPARVSPALAAGACRPGVRSLLPPGDAPGLEIAADERVVVEPASTASTWMLRGSFRLRPAACEVVPRGDALLAAGREGWGGVGDPDAVAVVGVTLVLVGNVEVGPTVLRLEVPTYDAAGLASPEQVVTGQFAVDLRALPGMPRRPQTYTIWAFAGEAMAEPIALSVVTEHMLTR